jgi:hypothetical protein
LIVQNLKGGLGRAAALLMPWFVTLIRPEWF